MSFEDAIVPDEARTSAITMHSLGVGQLTTLFAAAEPGMDAEGFESLVVTDNALGLGTEAGRKKRWKSLKTLFAFEPNSVLFRGLRDLWDLDTEAQPVLAGLCGSARDVVLRSTISLLDDTPVGDEVDRQAFSDAVADQQSGAYSERTLRTVGENAYASWEQTGHLVPSRRGFKERVRATCRPANVAYALMLGHLQGHRGEALFDTVWTTLLDQPTSHLHDLAAAASRQGMLEYRHAGSVIEVGFDHLLRPMDGQLL